MNIADLQRKIGITADGVWGSNTLKAAAAFYKLSNNRAAHFFAQTYHETGGFKSFSENLNYSADALCDIFKKYYPTHSLALSYEYDPEKIANKVYANRMGNGDENSGDGYKYRGRGAIQLTGKDMYQEFANYCNRQDIMSNPDLIADEFAFDSALWFFDKNHIWSICDRGTDNITITQVTQKINGGTLGLVDRETLTHKYIVLLGS